MSTLDRRKLIDDTLPKLSAQIAPLVAAIGEGIDWRTTSQSSWRSQADLSKGFNRDVQEDGNGGYVYIYRPYRKPGVDVYHGDFLPGRSGREVVKECQIKFYNLRVTDIIDRQYGPLDQSPAGQARSTTRKIPNDSPEPITKNVSHEDKQWTEWSESLGLLLEAEIEQTVKAGFAAYGVESETKLRVRSEVDTESSQSGGSEVTDTDSTSTIVRPFHNLEIVTSRQPVNINQNVVVTGELECDIDIVLEHCYGEACVGFDRLLDVFRGIGAKNSRVRSWFSNPRNTVDEHILKSIQRPTVTLDIGLKGVQGMSVEQTFRQRPIEKEEIHEEK